MELFNIHDEANLDSYIVLGLRWAGGRREAFSLVGFFRAHYQAQNLIMDPFWECDILSLSRPDYLESDYQKVILLIFLLTMELVWHHNPKILLNGLFLQSPSTSFQLLYQE